MGWISKSLLILFALTMTECAILRKPSSQDFTRNKPAEIRTTDDSDRLVPPPPKPTTVTSTETDLAEQTEDVPEPIVSPELPTPQLPVAEPSVEAPKKELYKFHRVRKGQTLYSISRQLSIPVQALAAWNQIANPNRIHVGQYLRYLESGEQGQDLIWPLDGPTISGYGRPRGRGRRHKGIDITAATGTPIRAVADGKIIFTGSIYSGYGQMVKIEHDHKIMTIYAHASRLTTSAGMSVRQGQVIAFVGETGNASGPHLHFEIHENKKPINPVLILPPRSRRRGP